MILYNVTIAVDPEIHDDWFQWMRNEHMPRVLNTGMFVDAKMFKVLLEKGDAVTYAIQYRAISISDLQQYLARFAPELQQESLAKYGQKAVAFRTVLEEIA